jgi:hypothetical protein
MAKKTILIIIDRWVSYRDMVFSNVLQRLREAGYDVALGITSVVTIRADDANLYLKDTRIVPVDSRRTGIFAPVSRLLDKLSHKVMRDLMTFQHPDITLSQTRQHRWHRLQKNALWRSAYARGLYFLGLRWRHVTRAAQAWGGYGLFGKMLDELKPAAIVYSNMLIGSADYLKEARSRCIKLVLDVPSWDNPTSKGPLTVTPDHALAWSENMKEELVRYHEIPAAKIHSCGVLAYTPYFQPPTISCEELRQSLGIPHGKHIILYAMGTPNQAACMTLFIDKLLTLIREHQLDAVLVIRISPRDNEMFKREFSSDPLLFINRPSGSVQPGGNWMPDEREAPERAALLRASSILVTMQSSMVLEACCADRPIINLAYDAGLQVPPWESVERFYRYSHALPVVEADATSIVRNDADLVEALQSYLKDPALRRSNRRALLAHACQYSDGDAAHRWADTLAEIVRHTTVSP